jgi:hypothetical protein
MEKSFKKNGKISNRVLGIQVHIPLNLKYEIKMATGQMNF